MKTNKKQTSLKTSTQVINNIYKINLKVKKNENILVFTDNIDTKLINITKLVAKTGKKHKVNIKYNEIRATESHGAEPPENLWISAFGSKTLTALKKQKLLKPLLNKRTNSKQIKTIENIVKKHRNDAVNAVIALSYYSTTHTRFRDLLTRLCGTRYASMPLFDKSMLSGVMKVAWKKMSERTINLAHKVNRGEKIEISTPNGTYLTFSKKGRKAKADTGIITKQGSSSNLPAGEVYLSPLEGTANGRLVLEWAPTQKLKHPITLEVKNGVVTDVLGRDNYARYLRKKLSERKENANIAELGIGTNNKASRPDNILESEKILGTIHIALGDNSSFGGKVSTPFHQDFVFFKPTLILIYRNNRKKELIKNGRISTK